MSVNKAILIGRVGKDPEVRFTQEGKAIANFSIATSENWKDKSGEKQEKTEWHNIVAFGKLAEIIGEYVKKGSLLYIEGKITTEKWQDKETGKDRYTTKIIAEQMKMLGGKPESVDKPTDHQAAPNQNKPVYEKFDDNFSDDIPFRESCLHYGLWRSM